MLFLKKFYAYGFKSFAEEINIEFNDEMTGIVGPNGAGKSNIVDAFKWVLGEQSIKDMRGSSKFDLIFKGSSNHPESKYAQVTLTFDNSSKALHYDEDVISITRKLFRDSGENEYYINNQPSRLKDIQMIFTDTGLSKGSLGIISQGTVNSFSEAKPESRRKMFEEAAGIGMYSIQKSEALRHLEKAEQSLTTIMALEKEIEKDLKKLSKQAETAKIWKEKHDKLKDIELTILVRDIAHFNRYKEQLEFDISNSNNDKEKYEPLELEMKSKLEYVKLKLVEADSEFTEFNNKLFEINETITSLEKKQLLFNSKLEDDISSDNQTIKISAYEKLISTHKIDIDNFENRIEEITTQISTYEDIYSNIEIKKNEFNEKINSCNISLTEKMTRLKMINEQIQKKSNQSYGVRTILENKQAIFGVHDTVGKFISVEHKYEIAISKALGQSVDNIIIDSSENAKNAIKFLKKNNAGKATFLPLKEIKSRYVKSEHLDILSELEGFVGVASKLISVDPKMQIVIDALIGQVIISSDIDSAIRISKYTFQLYKIITLEGDIIFPGGALTGGSDNYFTSSFNLEKNKEEFEIKVKELEAELIEAKIEHEKVIIEHNETSIKLNEKKYTLNNINNSLENAKMNFEKYKSEYEILTKKSFDSSKALDSNTIQEEINNLNSQRDKIRENLNSANNNKYNYTSQVSEYDGKLEDIRLQFDKIKEALSKFKQEEIKCLNFLENTKNRINENYQMTLDFAVQNYNKELPMSEPQAREVINSLKSDIDSLGAINLTAIEELEDKQSKFDLINKNRNETEVSVQNIRQSIIELDKEAKAKFSKIINDVNEALPSIFKFLFGGGSCNITFTEPDNILESGIEVMAHPPGKRISNLKLLSGGEKTLVAISVLFAILKISSFPIVILDEAEAALDIANVERFAQIIRQNSNNTQFLVITHRPGTMKECKTLLGATMQTPGVTNIISVSLEKAVNLTDED